MTARKKTTIKTIFILSAFMLVALAFKDKIFTAIEKIPQGEKVTSFLNGLNK